MSKQNEQVEEQVFELCEEQSSMEVTQLTIQFSHSKPGTEDLDYLGAVTIELISTLELQPMRKLLAKLSLGGKLNQKKFQAIKEKCIQFLSLTELFPVPSTGGTSSLVKGCLVVAGRSRALTTATVQLDNQWHPIGFIIASQAAWDVLYKVIELCKSGAHSFSASMTLASTN